MNLADLPFMLAHVTPVNNIGNIIDVGIDPKFSRGKRPVCWFTDNERIYWAIMHVSARHNIPVSGIGVFVVEAKLEAFQRTNMLGVYTCKIVQAVDREWYFSAMDLVPMLMKEQE